MLVYRSPTTCPKQALEELRCSFLPLFDHTNHIVVAGDLNIDLLSDSHTKDEYVSLLADFSLVQHKPCHRQ